MQFSQSYALATQLSQSYVLVLAQPSDDLQNLGLILEGLRCPLVMTSSVDQMIANVSSAAPYLVILACNDLHWSKRLVSRLRTISNARYATIVTLTDSHLSSWFPQDDDSGLDGFLVKPLSGDILVSLVQSALARQTFSPVS